MPDLLDRIYCSEQIHIPPTFPYIMKLYCKAAIRTQPYDLLKWSAAYFRALANGEEPPAKERIEYPPYDSPSGLTPGYIKILINQLGKDPTTTITAQALFARWSDICLQEQLLIQLIALLGATTTVNWVKFVAVCAGFISKTLTQTMILICELFTDEPEGGMATIPFDLFVDLYMFLAQMECGPLTDKEKEHQEAIMVQQDVCEVAGKIKQGIYEEQEGEGLFEEEGGEETIEVEEGTEGEKSGRGEEEEEEEEETPSKEMEDVSYISEDEPSVAVSVDRKIDTEIKGEHNEEEQEKEEIPEQLVDGMIPSGKSSKEMGSVKSATSGEGEREGEGSIIFEGEGEEGEKELEEQKEVKYDRDEKAEVDEHAEKPRKHMKLEDLEETIRAKIEEKLGMDEEEDENYEQEENREFENLNNYLLGTAARVQRYKPEDLGYRIFKRFMRQEVPGIGPAVDIEQVERVVDFLDYWSHKQETMVMPRNIRHWMCPPLDNVPTPEP